VLEKSLFTGNIKRLVSTVTHRREIKNWDSTGAPGTYQLTNIRSPDKEGLHDRRVWNILNNRRRWLLHSDLVGHLKMFVLKTMRADEMGCFSCFVWFSLGGRQLMPKISFQEGVVEGNQTQSTGLTYSTAFYQLVVTAQVSIPFILQMRNEARVIYFPWLRVATRSNLIGNLYEIWRPFTSLITIWYDNGLWLQVDKRALFIPLSILVPKLKHCLPNMFIAIMNSQSSYLVWAFKDNTQQSLTTQVQGALERHRTRSLSNDCSRTFISRLHGMQ